MARSVVLSRFRFGIWRPCATGNRWRAAGLVALALAGTALAGAATATDSTDISLVVASDFDGFDAVRDRGGLPRLATVIAREKQRNRNTMLIVAGDFLSPSVLSGFDEGQHMVDLIGKLDPALVLPGNHEFDFGPDVLLERLRPADFPVIAGNIVEPDRQPFGRLPATRMITVDGFRIGFLGLTTSRTGIMAKTGRIKVPDPMPAAGHLAAMLRRDGADIVIGVVHLTRDEDFALIKAGHLDIILSGADPYLMAYAASDVVLAESEPNARTVVTLRLARDDRGRVRWTPGFHIVDTADVAPDPAMDQTVAVYRSARANALGVPVGRMETRLDSRRDIIRSRESAIGNLIADALRHSVAADVAIMNAGGIRADRVYEPGTLLTSGDVLKELPFGNRKVVLEITGKDLWQALEHGASGYEDGAGRFPQVSGMRVVMNVRNPPGERIRHVAIGDAPLDPEAIHTLATNDFMARGGDGYGMLVGLERIIRETEGQLVVNDTIDWIAAGNTAPRIDGRIVLE